uniref:Uncharacterized protein n=1 Tax=Hanusia phi TaxID=3032 RepID=A0A7S0HY63_9CRYP|mmetsp:Transcript_5939/g.13727  ORF Transcript_5939/g.13727 Transcript_5939/m.13727 type:complete len:421 (+) Transcript_5939:1-1263(+)
MAARTAQCGWVLAATAWMLCWHRSFASVCEVDTFSAEYGKIAIDLKAYQIPDSCCADMRRIMSSTRLMKLKGIIPAPRWLHGSEGESCSDVCRDFGEVCIEHGRLSLGDTKQAAAQAEVSCNQNISGALWLPDLQPSFSLDSESGKTECFFDLCAGSTKESCPSDRPPPSCSAAGKGLTRLCKCNIEERLSAERAMKEASMKGCDKAFAGLNDAIAQRHEQVHVSNRAYDKAQIKSKLRNQPDCGEGNFPISGVCQPCRKGYYCPAGVFPVACAPNTTSPQGSTKPEDCSPRDQKSLEREQIFRQILDESYQIAFREHEKALDNDDTYNITLEAEAAQKFVQIQRELNLELWGVNSSMVEQYSMEEEKPLSREELLFWEMEEVRKRTAEKLQGASYTEISVGANVRGSEVVSTRESKPPK